MYFLHIETSTKICSAAISLDRDVIHYFDLTEGLNHTALLAPTIDQLLKFCEISPKDLGAISVSSGPGSYTGLRVGSSTAKAMAYSLKIPIIAVPTLLSLAKAGLDQYPEAMLAFPMIDARRNEVYTSLYDRSLSELLPTTSLIVDEKEVGEVLEGRKDIIACGDGSGKLGELAGRFGILVDPGIQCSARHLAGLAYDLFSEGRLSDAMHFVPFYLKPPNITRQKNLL